MKDSLLSIEDLVVEFKTDVGTVRALDGISFELPRKCITAIVGESGSGKSVTASSIMRLLPGSASSSGAITFRPLDGDPIHISSLEKNDPLLLHLRGGMVSMIFQEPMTALSPVHQVGDQVAEAVLCHRDVTRDEALAEAATMLSRVGIVDAANKMHQYPFEFSGGMRQRVVIAMALICHPQLLLCDEPTTALDVTTQADILVLIKSLQQEFNNSVLFVTHDLGVVAQIADRVIVMYRGQIVESGSVREVLKTPKHVYTRHLLTSVPGMKTGKKPGGFQAWRVDDWKLDAAMGSNTTMSGPFDGHQVREFKQ